jgi:hypothetical protein
MANLFFGVCCHGCLRNLSVHVAGQGAGHDLEKAVAYEFEMLAHGVLRRMGLALGNGCDYTAVLLDIDLLALA